MTEVKGNGNVTGIKRSLSCSEGEDGFLGFDTAEQNDSQHVIQNIKKICTDSSSDEMNAKKQLAARTTDILDPAFKLPFKYGWKRELVTRAEPTMSKEKGEVYYITPSGKKLRTRHEIQSHLHDDLTINNFTLVKEAIGASQDDEIIRPAKYYNYQRRSNVDPVIADSPQAPLGKRTPKPKLPKGASPPPPSSTNAQQQSVHSPSNFSSPFASSNKNVSKENYQEKPISARKPAVAKGKSKGDARCTIQCSAALGKIPQLQCKHCLCLYHHECANFNANLDASTFVCENCNFKQVSNKPTNASQQQLPSKKHHQPQVSKHNFETHPQALITYNGKKFIMFESDDSSNDAKKIINRATTQNKVNENEKLQQNRLQESTTTASSSSLSSISPLNHPVNYFRNVSAGFDILLHVFQYLKVQELQRAARVSRMWNLVSNSSILWRTVRMKNSHVNDWSGFVRTLKHNGTIHLDLRKVLMGNQEEAWREFSEKIGDVDQLQGIDLCRCTSNIVENLFKSNPNLRTINAAALKDEKINLEDLNQREVGLEELRLRSVHNNGLLLQNVDFLALLNLRHLSLTTIENLHDLLNNNGLLGNMTALESLELGNCELLNDQELADNLITLKKLSRLRIEKGLQNFSINKILDTIATSLSNMTQLELINCDVKNNFVESISQCKQLKRLLLIPTYVSQSAATNFMIMQGVMTLTNLDYIHWVVTNELLRVTELYLDQSDNRVGTTDKGGKKSPDKHGALSPVKARDCIPVLKPVPGKEKEEEMEVDDATNKQQQVEIVPLKIVESILSSKLSTTKVKLLKIPHANTWRQSLEI